MRVIENMCWQWYQQSSSRPCKHEVCWAPYPWQDMIIPFEAGLDSAATSSIVQPRSSQCPSSHLPRSTIVAKGGGVMSATHLDHRQYGPSDCCPWRQSKKVMQQNGSCHCPRKQAQRLHKDFTKIICNNPNDQNQGTASQAIAMQTFPSSPFSCVGTIHSRESFAASQCLNILNKESIKEMARWLYGCSNMQHF